VFELVYSAKKKTYTEQVLYRFGGNPDGDTPYAGLIFDKLGNLYGTTIYGGANGYGTVFEVTTGGVESVLYSFCSQPSCTDGKYPAAPLLQDKNGNLYSTTGEGGTSNMGTVFELPTGGEEKVLWSFTGPPDGRGPSQGALVQDKKGNLYGSTEYGGTNNFGAVFKVPPK